MGFSKTRFLWALCFLALLTGLHAAPNPASLPGPGTPNVILLTLDTTRADHLGCYGFRAAETPVLDRLAGEGARFESAFSAVPNTLPSHATILTGLYPFHTGVRDNLLYRLPKAAVTLAEILQGRGYRTMAFVSAAVLDRTFGLDQGFSLYDDRIGGAAGPAIYYDERNAGAVNQALLARLPEVTTPYFLWMHYYDPHEPYAAPAPYGGDKTRSPYDAELSYMDHEIGWMLDQLASRKLLENTLIVVVGDHGESLGDHGERTHGVFLYDSVLRVPLILWYPKNIPAGAVVRGMARTVDVLPTILDFAGAGPAAGVDGISLRKAVESGLSEISFLYEETYLPENQLGWSPLFGYRTPQWHFVLAPRSELYDLQTDPLENHNVIEKSQKIARDMESKLRQFPLRPAKSEPIDVPDELKEQIASLGYVSSAKAAGASSGMDPKDGIVLLGQIDAATKLVSQNRQDDAIAILNDVLKRNPQNVPARVILGQVYLGRRNYAAAQEQFNAALQVRPLDTIHLDLALALAGLGRFREAASQYQQALALNPRQLRAYVNWAELSLRLKQDAEAASVLQRAEDADVRGVELTLLRGRLAAYRGNLQEAIRLFQQAETEDPQTAVAARFFLGSAYLQAGNLDEAIASFNRLLEAVPDYPAALRLLGDIYSQKKEAQQAIMYYERFLRAAPGDPDVPLVKERLRRLAAPRP